MKEISIKVKDLIKLCLIIFGEWNGVQFQITPKLPSCLANGYRINGVCSKADFWCMTLDDESNLKFWFETPFEESFSCDFDCVKKDMPLLLAAIITNLFDMIDNAENQI